MTDARRIGVVAGLAEELDCFLPDCEREVASFGTLRVARIERGGRTLFLASGGIGKVAAATAASVLATRHGVELLAVIGTAGNLSGLAPGAYAIDEALQTDFGAQRAGRLVRYTAGEMPIGPDRVIAIPADLIADNLPRVRVGTSDLFVQCVAHAAHLRESVGAMVVDMETGAVAQVARLLGLPWTAIKAVTDDAGAGSANDFQSNFATAARQAAKAMERALGLNTSEPVAIYRASSG